MIRKELTPQQLADLQAAQAISEVLPQLEDEIDKMSQSKMADVFRQINENILTPELAMSYWLEMYAYHRLNKRLVTKAAMTKVPN